MTKILGIDLGFTKANPSGIVVVEFRSDGHLEIVRHGTIGPEKKTPDNEFLNHTLYALHAWVKTIVYGHHVGYVAYESVYVSASVATTIKMAQLIGAIKLATFSDPRPKLMEVAPSQAKQAMTGHGKASKEAMREVAEASYPALKGMSQHEIDAMGVALAGIKRAIAEMEGPSWNS
jgi:Holliday junction resolvasome RuvABC endonuclease subunit